MYRFIFDEDGAVTVDWVVITAAIVMFCVVTLGVIYDASLASTADVGAILHEY